MTIYLTLNAERIQAYISRTTQLRLVRGASELVKQAFLDLEEAVGNGEFPGVNLPGHGGVKIDGKTTLKVDLDELASDPNATLGDIESTVDKLVGKLRAVAPALQIGASWATAVDEAAFYALDNPNSKTYLPPSLDLPLVRRCDVCGIYPAQGRLKKGANGRACADCRAREKGNKSWRQAHQEESRTLSDFTALARFGPTHSPFSKTTNLKVNHLATFKADGNRLGALFRALGDSATMSAADKAKNRETLSEGVKYATAGAIENATEAVKAKAAALGAYDKHLVISHIKGGDDFLASMPAAYGFIFAREYLKTFKKLATQSAREVGVLEDHEYVTACGGLCISHVNYPFSAAAEAADDLVGQSKKYFKGNEAGFNWVNLTDSTFSIAKPIKVETLVNSWESIEEIGRTISSSGQANLNFLARNSSYREIMADVTRVYGEAGAKAVQHFLLGETEDETLTLLTVLGMLKWWV